MTLIDKKWGKAIRIAVRVEVILANKKTGLFQNYRMKGIPPAQVPLEVVEPPVDKVMNVPEEQRLQISEIFDYPYQEPPHSFSSFVCEDFAEMVVEEYGRLENGKKVCIPRAEKK